ncbi:hypothetical protein PROFUN_11034 [Planoprotostelium fungivorum]|uniref:Uncharacterized protein n=1 Tax=Planoprotostelium fungivorum TaxID=1890364 RepID=A0A2P6NBV3_9EUKA|nr:hypothetical protein PROFUN_11034 [Planoprotostelium fungivorum]
MQLAQLRLFKPSQFTSSKHLHTPNYLRPSIRNLCQRRFNSDASSPTRHAYALISEFLHPDLGMKDFEVLSRSSLFLVNASKGQEKRLHLLGPAHVTHPWLFPHFYPESSHDWLKHVDETYVRLFLGIQDPLTGETKAKFRIDRDITKSDHLDLVAMTLEEETDFYWYCNENQQGPYTVEFSDDPAAGMNVRLEGHNYSKEEGVDTLRPKTLEGEVSIGLKPRSFVKTEERAVMGMCGGPAIATGTDNSCVGMVESMVGDLSEDKSQTLTPEHVQQWKSIEGHVVIITSDELAKFVREREEKASGADEEDF